MDPQETTTSWASRRKAIYLWSTLVVCMAVGFLLFWKFWYQAPTCFDTFKNGDETGIDCGGSCSLVCAAEALPPILRSDPRAFLVYPNVYSVVTFVENRNIDSTARAVPYTFKLYDSGGNIIAERSGTTDLLKSRTAAVFEGNIQSSTTPARVSFELSKNITWVKDREPLPEVILTHSPLLQLTTTPKIEAEIKNNSLETLKNIQIVAAVLDGRDNVVAASRTFVDRLQKDQSSDIFFTWPAPFALGERVCEKPSDVVLAIDRSGSMASLSKNPPEPLTSVKSAATSFISQLKKGDSAALVSFATDATTNSELTSDFSALQKSIESIAIATSSTQYTNIADAITRSLDSLSLGNAGSQKALIILTDGIANRPQDPIKKTEAADIAYAEKTALEKAALAKQQGTTIYTIGLGKDIHDAFLKQVAASSTAYFFAPTAAGLKDIYQKISLSICKEAPARIETFVSF